MKRLLFLVTALSLVLLMSCKKDSSPTKKDLLTAKSWKLSAYTIDPQIAITDPNGNITGYTNDMYALLPDCSKDNTRKFNSDGSFVADEGVVKCDATAAQTTTGTWVFNSDQSGITLTGNTSVIYTIVELTSTTLKIQTVAPIITINYTETLTFTNN